MNERDLLIQTIHEAIDEWNGITDPSAHLPEYIARHVKYTFELEPKE